MNQSILTTAEIEQISSWVREAGQGALARQKQAAYQVKADESPVTDADLWVDGFIRERLAAAFPQIRLLTEESGLGKEGGAYSWVLDPIDGTRSFMNGMPIWGVSLGLLVEGLPRLGFFYMPAVDEFYLSDGQQAWLNGQPFTPRCTEPRAPAAFLAVPSNAHLRYDFSARMVRSMGAVAAHFTYLARGAAVGVLADGVYLWDLAGVLPLANACGIRLEYLDGEEFHPEVYQDGSAIRRPLLAAYPQHLAAVRALIQAKRSG